MALLEKSVSITMGQAGGSRTAIHVNALKAGEIPDIRQALDTTQVYKSSGYSVVYEEDTFTDGSMSLPAAVVMTGKRDATVIITLKNAVKQYICIGLEIPVNMADTTALATWVAGFEGKVLGALGTVDSATFKIKQ